MALYLFFSSVIVYVVAKVVVGRLLEKIVDYVVAPMVEYVVAPIGDSLVAPIGEYLVFPIGRQLGFLLRYSSNIRDFRNQVEILTKRRDEVQMLVDGAERNGEIVLPIVQTWLTSANKIIEEARKFFDGLPENKRFFNRHFLDLKAVYQRSKYAKRKTIVVDELQQGFGCFDKVIISTKDAEVFESRKSIFENIMKALKDDRINMIGIYGMAGVGKTTLAKEVVQQAEADNLFDAVMMIGVSQAPYWEKIQHEIAEALDPGAEKKGESGRAGQISTKDKKKRILIILDDIWESVELEAIGISFGMKHCKVLLTSRSQDVCNQMHTDENFRVEVITEEEGWNLFRKIAGDSVEDPVIFSIAVEVAKECAGLPIALVTVARALKNRSLSEWRDALNQQRSSNPSKKVFSAIELSYNHLESEEAKSLFLLCCLFPEDYNIAIRDLLRYGMGLGLFQDVDTVDEARERAHRLANDLAFSCLLQVIDDGKCVRMHDVVRDVAISIARKDKHALLVRAGLGYKEFPKTDIFEQYTAISLMSNDIHELPDELECPSLRILLLQYCSHPSIQFPNNFFWRMNNLRVLDMSGLNFWSLPSSLQYLKNLRTLCLDGCKLGNISIIGKLKKLEILSFIASDIKELPAEIGKLICLRLLDLTQCAELTMIPPNVIRGLSKLEGLYMDRSFHEWQIGRQEKERSNSSLEELKHLSYLIDLEIEIPDADLFPEDLVFESLSRFKISIGSSIVPWECYSYSKILKLELNVSTVLKDGVKSLLREAEHLHLVKMKGLKSVLDLDTEGFRNLRWLDVNQCGEMEYICTTSEWFLPLALPILEKLYLYKLANLKEICHGQVPRWFFCNLTVVQVESCDGLKYLFSHSVAKDLSNLVEITVAGCKDMEEIVVHEKEAEAKAAVDNIVFPHLRSLVLKDLPNLRNFCPKLKKGDLDTHKKGPLFNKKIAFTNLEVLQIINIENLQEIFHSQLPDESFSQLRILRVTECHKLLRVAPPNLLPRLKNLETLIVEKCNLIEEIFEFEGHVGEGHTVISLFQLENVKLHHLPNLKIFFLGNYNLELPSLLTLRLEMCCKMKTFSSKFISTPKLETVEIENQEKVWKGDLNTTIQHLFLEKVGHTDTSLGVRDDI